LLPIVTILVGDIGRKYIHIWKAGGGLKPIDLVNPVEQTPIVIFSVVEPEPEP
jgi:hypothetical protein